MAVEKPTLTVDGVNFEGWTDCQVTLSMEAASGAFSLGVTERWPGQQAARPIRPGAKCVLVVGGDTLISGYVNDVSISYDAYSHSISVTGRDAAGDMVDCSANSGSWSGLTLERIVAAIAAPFGGKVAVQTDVGAPFKQFKIQEGETAWSAIERACRMRGVLCMSDGAGNVVLARASTGSVMGVIRGGEKGMILQGSAEYSDRDRFSEYRVKGQSAGADGAGAETSAHGSASATDAGVKRYRPKVIVAEDQGDSGSLRARVEWEAKVARGRSRKANLTVFGWRDADGRLWRPNRLVRVACDWLRLEDDMMVATVRLNQSANDGTTADLDLVHPDTFAAEPASDREDPGW